MAMRGFFSVCATILLLLDGFSMAGVSIVKNGSFENDGYIGHVIPQDTNTWPEHWCDVSYDGFIFDAYVSSIWKTHGSYSLTFYNVSDATFQAGDSATVAQSGFFSNARQISFDIELTTEWPQDINWGDYNLFSAVLIVDNDIIWDSNEAGIFENGQYHIEVNDLNISDGVHILAIGIRANTTLSEPYYYWNFARWDFIKFDTVCGGAGFLPADLTRDCVVDINDLKAFAEGWLDPNGPDLTGDTAVDFADFAILADSWMLDNRSPDQNDPCYLDPNFVFLDADLNDDGIVDYDDFVDFCNDWLSNGGPCVRANLDHEGVVDFADFAILTEYWQQTGDLYGL
jgi:hypothetical protein